MEISDKPQTKPKKVKKQKRTTTGERLNQKMIEVKTMIIEKRISRMGFQLVPLFFIISPDNDGRG